MIRGIGVTNPVLPRRDSGGRGSREDPPGQAEAEPKASASREQQGDASNRREPPDDDATHHIDEYA